MTTTITTLAQLTDYARWSNRYSDDYPDLIEREAAYTEYLKQRAVFRRIMGD